MGGPSCGSPETESSIIEAKRLLRGAEFVSNGVHRPGCRIEEQPVEGVFCFFLVAGRGLRINDPTTSRR